MMGKTGYSETSVNIYQTIRCHMTKGSDRQNHQNDDIKCPINELITNKQGKQDRAVNIMLLNRNSSFVLLFGGI